MTNLPPNAAIQAITSICSSNDLRLLGEWCEAGAKKACRQGTQICEMVLDAERKTGAIDLHALESIAERITEIRDSATLYMRMRETLTPETGCVVLQATKELDRQLEQITEALAAVEDRISNLTRPERKQSIN